MKKTILSGVKPTGSPHIGNYFGAMKQFVDLQDQYDCNIFIADLHAITTIQNKEELNKNIMDVATNYLAIGLNPEKTKIFKQSDIPQVTELAWIFNCITSMPYLMRAHAFKDSEAKNKEINVGVFDYPVLMAADILIQDADLVPVGKDQKQHIEYARDIAEKFNKIYFNNETFFKLPKELIIEDVETVPGIDGRKMSKSYKNTIPLFASDEEIKKLVMSIVTDSGSDIPHNVYNIHKLFRGEDELNLIYKENTGKYKILKEILIEDIQKYISPMRERKIYFENHPQEVLKILDQGKQEINNKISNKMDAVRKLVGYKI